MQFPFKLLTDKDGPAARLRVDVAQTGFFAGRELRAFLRLNIAAGTSQVVKVVAPIDFILFVQRATIHSGELDISSRVGGTEGGSFSTTIPTFRTNNMSVAPPYTGQLVITTGGTHTGGTELSALQVKANSVTSQAASVGASDQDERGIAAGTYYLVLTNQHVSDPVEGIFDVRWEERPS